MEGDPPQTPEEKKRTFTIQMLRSLLTSVAKIGIPVHMLKHEYQDLVMEPLDERAFGYGSLLQFLKDIPEVCRVSNTMEGYPVVKGIPSKEDAHVFNLVAGQKNKKPKKKKNLHFSFNASQVKRRPNFKPGGVRTPYSNHSNFGRPGVAPRTYSKVRQTPTYITSRQTQPPLMMRNSAINQTSAPLFRQEIPPRFQKQNASSGRMNNSFMSNVQQEPILLSNVRSKTRPSGPMRLPSGEIITVNEPATSTPNSTIKLSIEGTELSVLEKRLQRLLTSKPNGLFATRLRAEYKTMFQEELPDDIPQIIKKYFLDMIRIDRPMPNREILHLIKKENPNILQIQPAKAVKLDDEVQITAVFSPNGENVTRNVNKTKKTSLNNELKITTAFTPNGSNVTRKVESSLSPIVKSPFSPKTPTSLRAPNGKVQSPPREEFYIASLELPKTGDSVKVFVCHVESLDRFFVQLSVSPIDNLLNQMQEFYKGNQQDLNIIKPRLSEYYCARYSVDQLWFRAKILSVKEQKNSINESYRCRVMYIDYGNDETVISSELKCLTKDFCEVPIQAIQCSLYDMFPMEDNTWTDATIQYFRELTDNMELTLVIQEKNGNLLKVDLLHEDGQSVCHHLVSKGQARRSQATPLSRTSSSSDISDSKSSSLWRSLSLDSSELTAKWAEFPTNQDYIDVLVSHINGTTDLSLILIGPENHEKLENFESHITKFYDDESIPASNSLEVGKYYAGMTDDTWYRVKLLSISDSECSVLLVDHGKNSIINVEEIKDLSPCYYRLPFQRISCALDKVPSVCELEVLSYLSELTLGKPLLAYISSRPSTPEGQYLIDLFDTSEGDVNVNKEILGKIETGKDLEPKMPEIGGGSCYGYIAHVNSVGDFFLQIHGPALVILEELMEDMTTHFATRTKASEIIQRPEVGMICCAKFHHDGTWYRAKITKVMLRERKVEVEFVDYANREVIAMVHIREPSAVSEKVISLPFQAVRCRLDSLSPASCNDDECSKIKEFINQYVEVITVEVLRYDNEIPVVKLCIPSENENNSPIDFMVKYQQTFDAENQNIEAAYNELSIIDSSQQLSKSKLESTLLDNTAINNTTFENISVLTPTTTTKANMTLSEWDVISDSSPDRSASSDEVDVQRVKSELHSVREERQKLPSSSSEAGSDNVTPVNHSNTSDRSESPATTFSAMWGIPDMPIEHRFIEGIVQDTTDPYKFSIIPSSRWKQLEEMHINMMNFYSQTKTSDDITFRTGDVCAAYHVEHEIWYRAVIHTQVEEQMVVKFPDFSNTLELVSSEHLRPLYPPFKVLPFLAIRCSLSGIQPLNGGKSWPNDAAMTFSNLVMNETFQVELMCDLAHLDKSKPLEVRLHGANSQGERFVVNERLVTIGMAKRKLPS